MRATRAYIASAGTAAVMLGASLCCFILLSAFVAFGAWPGASSGTSVDQLVLRSAQHQQAARVTVRRDAVLIAQRRAAAQKGARTVALAKRHGTAVAVTPTGARTEVAAAPTSGTGSTKSSGGGSSPADTVKPVTNQVTDTTNNTTTQVQQVTTQVEQVVNQVVGGTPPPTSSPTQTVTGIVGH